jgi:hypothetical protein
MKKLPMRVVIHVKFVGKSAKIIYLRGHVNRLCN